MTTNEIWGTFLAAFVIAGIFIFFRWDQKLIGWLRKRKRAKFDKAQAVAEWQRLQRQAMVASLMTPNEFRRSILGLGAYHKHDLHLISTRGAFLEWQCASTHCMTRVGILKEHIYGEMLHPQKGRFLHYVYEQ